MSADKFGWRIVIHSSRYSGVYEGGEWFATYIGDAFPEDSIGSDIECATFFAKFMDIIGVGNTPNEALDNLIEKNKDARDFYEKYMNRQKAGKSWASKLKPYEERYFTKVFRSLMEFRKR